MRRRKAWLIVALGIALYCIFVGASASVVRAGFMGILLVLGPAFGRRSLALNALAISALVMAVQAPLALWDVGFQLSFAATLGLIVLATPLTAAYQQWLVRRVPSVGGRTAVLFAGGDLMATLAATLATLPILLYDFHNFSLLSLPVNLLVLPAQPPIMATGFFVILGGLIHPALGQVFGWIAWPFLVWTTGIVEGVAALPYAAFDIGTIPLWIVIAYYLLLIAGAAYIVQPAQRRAQLTTQFMASLPKAVPLWPLAPLALAGALVWVAALSQPDGRLHVSFLDVGQGDATLVQTPSGRLVVIDGGPAPSSLNDAVSRSLPFYQRELPLVILTRATDEKMAGLVSLLERYHIEQVVLPPGALPKSATAQRWRQLLAQQFPVAGVGRLRGGAPESAATQTESAAGPAAQALGIISPTLGLRLDVGDGVVLEVVHVGDDPEGVSLRLSYGQVSVYLDGDGEQPVTRDDTATVLRVGRHGDAKAATPEMLNALAPQFAIISVGANNRGSTPSEETLTRLREAGATVYRTDENGSMRLTSDGEQVRVETEK
jgi:competence protein ComEC